MDYYLGKKAHRSAQASVIAYGEKWPILAESVFLACGARVIGDVKLGENCSLWFNAIVRGDVGPIEIGEGTNIQDGALIHCTYQKHFTKIGSYVSIGHQATLHGCTIEDDVLVGMQAIVMDGARIGRGSIVAAGALVTPGTQVPARSLVVGSPARVVRELRDDELSANSATCRRYFEYAKGYNFNL